MRDQGFADEFLRKTWNLFSVLSEFDPASFPSPSSMNLRLDDPAFTTQVLGNGYRVIDIVCHAPVRDRHAIAPEQFFCLVFVNIQGTSPLFCLLAGSE